MKVSTHQGGDASKDRRFGTRATLYTNTLGIGLLFAALIGCTAAEIRPDPGSGDSLSRSALRNRPQIVSTSTILTDLTAELAGEEINLIGILDPGADPHTYEPVPADIKALETAELILYNGYNLEPGLIRMINAAGVNAKKLAVGELVKPLDMKYEGQKVPDPHVWGDVANAIAMVNGIRDALIEISPEDADIFTANAAQLTAELQQLDTWIAQQIATIPPDKRKLVATHDAFQYYTAAYGLEVVGTLIGVSTEEKPSAKTQSELVEKIKKTGVPAIFAETTINPSLIQTVAQEAQVKLASQELYSDSIGAPGSEGDSYIKMMVSNTRTVVEALGGTYQPFEGLQGQGGRGDRRRQGG